MSAKPSRQLLMFVKTPERGLCKTRMIPLLGAGGAVQFYQQLVLHTLNRLKFIEHVDVTVFAYPDTKHDFIRKLEQDFPVRLDKQSGVDLGERMFNAINQSLQHYDRCVLIGSDCPDMDTWYIEQAFDALTDHDIVLGPASDGGYVLIGARRVTASLFENIQWSGEFVLQESLHNAQAIGYSTTLLQTLWDIDTPDDFYRHHKRIRQLLNSNLPTGDDNGSPTG